MRGTGWATLGVFVTFALLGPARLIANSPMAHGVVSFPTFLLDFPPGAGYNRLIMEGMPGEGFSADECAAGGGVPTASSFIILHVGRVLE
jgi:hypothetical protein